MTPKETYIELVEGETVRPSDVLVLLAGDGLYRVPHAVELFNQGMAPLIVTLSGDTRREYGSLPSSELVAHLVSKGVPEDAIYFEETALHTRAEAEIAMAHARERGWKKILIVTSPHHQFRALLTFIKAMKDAGMELELAVAAAPLSWDEATPWGTRRELFDGELERIERYQQKGDVATYEEGIDYIQWRKLRP